MLSAGHYLQPLQEKGFVDALDTALGLFIADQESEHGEEMGLVACILSQQLGAQHLCVSVDELCRIYNLWVAELQQPLPMLFESQLLGLLQQSRTVTQASEQRHPNTPLVLDNQALYLQRYWDYEVALCNKLRELASRTLEVDEEACGPILRQLFGDSAQTGPDWQQIAVVQAASQALCIITGGPGTGKTTTVTRLMALVQTLAATQGKRLRIAMTAPTGKAATRLTESIEQARRRLPESMSQSLPHQASTLHRLLGSIPNRKQFRHHRDNPLALDMLILDEASMVDLPLMAKLLDALPTDCRVVMLGDRQQLASVEVGSVLSDICASVPVWGEQQFTAQTAQRIARITGIDLEPCQQPVSSVQDNLVMLSKSHRFDFHSGIGQLASAVNLGNLTAVLRCLSSSDYADLNWYAEASPGELVELACRGMQDYFAAVAEKDIGQAFTQLSKQQVLCATRKGQWGSETLNRQIALSLMRRNWIKPQQELYAGLPVMITQNDYQVQLFNGDTGICLPDDNGLLKVWFQQESGTLRSILTSRLPAWQPVYAMTIHKSQGSEYEHAIISLGDNPGQFVSRELLYTGITRARKELTLFAPTQQLHNALDTVSQRGSGLTWRLQNSGAL
ncbi:exodeoxyribonuclease V subunit alpha [Lacimicrobium sp. SS2-24]|uniref:exodeoxyribonuclease V subunit alpha n=1 Tax=Lacimicrobium sp. SS2-24 TaxID=2005569 RepID=UPI000B4AE275|nr:exodeoxyribonuclease V subunit alpha [Lacimicrobium sp. SS2-24]